MYLLNAEIYCMVTVKSEPHIPVIIKALLFDVYMLCCTHLTVVRSKFMLNISCYNWD